MCITEGRSPYCTNSVEWQGGEWLGSIWKETVMASWRYYPGMCLEGLKNHKSPESQIWWDFDRASSLICGNKMPTRRNRGFYCRTYCLLNMFRASLCPSSGAQEYYTVVAACGISCCGFPGVELRVMRMVCRMLQHPANRTHNPRLHTRKPTARTTTGSNHCIILLSSWRWA